MNKNNIRLMNKEIDNYIDKIIERLKKYNFRYLPGEKSSEEMIRSKLSQNEIIDIFKEKIGILNIVENIDNFNTQLSELIVEYRLFYTIEYLSRKFNDNKKVKRIFSLLFQWCINSLNDKKITKDDIIIKMRKVLMKYSKEISLGFIYKLDSTNNIPINGVSKYGYGESNKKYIFRDQFIELFSYNQLNELIGIYKDIIDIHEFAENLIRVNNKYYKDEKFKEEYFQFLKKISKYKKSDILKLLRYMNYEKIRTAKNLSDMLTHIHTIEASKSGIVNSKIISPYMFTDFERKEYFWFNKELEEINTIGSRTYCCFRKGGAAQSLLKPAYYSPISGIIEGKFKNKEWFSFVWETVEYNKINNTFEVSLVLDNLEATSKLTITEMNSIIEMLKNTNKYSKVYLGYLRNDIVDEYLNSIKYTQKHKERSLVCYEQEFEKYSNYDDSREIFTIIDNNKVNNSEIIIKKMNLGDLHRCKYIEWYVWGEYSDNDFVNDVILDNSFVIQDNKNIYGYIITKKYWYNPKTKNIIFSTIKKSNSIIGNKEDYVPLIYIDDIFINKNKIFIKTLDKIFDEMIKYIQENNYQYYSCNCNIYSKPLLKRIPSNIQFISDNRYNNPNNTNGILPKIKPQASKIKINKKVVYEF